MRRTADSKRIGVMAWAAVAAVILAVGGGKATAGEYRLKLDINPVDGGSVSISPYKDTYNEREIVEVEATAAKGYVFTGWSDDDTSKSGSITVRMTGNRNRKLTANFMSEDEFKVKQAVKLKSYKYTGRTVKIGNQTWMAENLNNAAAGECYDNNPANCAKYGRLYTWDEAMDACPSGWHLPGDAEWETLVNYAGGDSIAGKKLKSKTGCIKNCNGTDEYGFSALPGGYGSADGNFDRAGYVGLWWSATEHNPSGAEYRYMSYLYQYVDKSVNGKTRLFSVRCVQE